MSTMNNAHDDVLAAIRSYILNIMKRKGADPSGYNDDMNFIDAGIIDSLEFVDLMSEVESICDTRIDLSPFEPEEFYTPKGLAKCIRPDVEEAAVAQIQILLIQQESECNWSDMEVLVLKYHLELAEYFPADEADRDIASRMVESMRKAVGRTDVISVARDGAGCLCGFCWGTLRTNRASVREGKKGYLSDLYIVESARHLGLGEKLMDRVEQWFSQVDVKVLECDVLVLNENARRLVARLGYQPKYLRYIKTLPGA